MNDSVPWYKEAVVYQIYPRSFKDGNNDGVGDIIGIIEKLDYLKELGITVVWLSPVYESPNDDNGYDISNYKQIMSDFGTIDDWKRMIKGLHDRGIRLVMDLVANHTSDEHPWFVESRSSIDNPKRDYYFWRKGQKNNKLEPNNWTSFFTGKAWTFDSITKEYYLHLFSKKQPDLNWDNPAVRNEMKDIIRYWLELGVDGFRCDVINILSKNMNLPNGKIKIALTGSEHYLNGPNIHTYLKELHRDVLSKYDCFTVGETVFVTTEEASKYVGEKRNELSMIFHFEHMAVDTINNKWFIRKYRVHRLKKVLSKWQYDLSGKKYPEDGPGWNALYFENHDQPRSVSRFGNDTIYWRESATMLATMLHFQQGTPYIYQGQEIGMTNAHFTNLSQYKDIETHNIYNIGRKVLHFPHYVMMRKIKYMSRDNARTPMQWDDSTFGGFSESTPWIEINPNKSQINVLSQMKNDHSIWKYYQTIIRLRKEFEVIVKGDFKEHFKHRKNIYCYERSYQDQKLIVICNGTKKKCTIDLSKIIDQNLYACLLSNYEVTSAETKFDLRPFEARVYIKK